MVDTIESRRSARIPGRFWIAVEGVDAELTPRHGDISTTGIFVEMDADIGDVGTVQWLHIASMDRMMTIHVMAHTVRHVHLSDVHRNLKGVALEFMPESDDAAVRLVEFVHYVLENPNVEGPTPHIAPRVRAAASPTTDAAMEAHLKELSVNTLLLETDWSVPVGEPVRVEIIARGVRRPIRVEGEAVSILPGRGLPGGPKRFRIAVQVKQEIAGPLRRFSSAELRAVNPDLEGKGTIDQLINALIQPPQEPPERKHLSGLLSRIPFTTLCSLLELERLTGELVVRRGRESHKLFVKDGRFVDVEPAPDGARAVLAALFAAREGAFELDVGAVDRPDKIGMSMTNLLLDLARVTDEANAPPEGDGGDGI